MGGWWQGPLQKEGKELESPGTAPGRGGDAWGLGVPPSSCAGGNMAPT